ncbi:MAG: hypothetical protein HYR91_13155 [Flavobacteriia bacterium]|nr:hypothetical protein [Flavobacteriia bacterium]
MKSNLLILFSFSFLMSVNFACKKKDVQLNETTNTTPTPTPEPVFNKIFTCKINSIDFSSTTINGVNNMGYLMISGKNGNTTVQVCTSTSNDPGTYPVITNLSQLIDNNMIYNCTSGSITITTHDKLKKQIYGTFSMDVVDNSNISRTISVGNFATTY